MPVLLYLFAFLGFFMGGTYWFISSTIFQEIAALLLLIFGTINLGFAAVITK